MQYENRSFLFRIRFCVKLRYTSNLFMGFAAIHTTLSEHKLLAKKRFAYDEVLNVLSDVCLPRRWFKRNEPKLEIRTAYLQIRKAYNCFLFDIY
jgi:hypothetical protein